MYRQPIAPRVQLRGFAPEPYSFADAHPELFRRLGLQYLTDYPVNISPWTADSLNHYRQLTTSKTEPAAALIVVQPGLG
jgi:hypothetical protein